MPIALAARALQRHRRDHAAQSRALPRPRASAPPQTRAPGRGRVTANATRATSAISTSAEEDHRRVDRDVGAEQQRRRRRASSTSGVGRPSPGSSRAPSRQRLERERRSRRTPSAPGRMRRSAAGHRACDPDDSPKSRARRRRSASSGKDDSPEQGQRLSDQQLSLGHGAAVRERPTRVRRRHRKGHRFLLSCREWFECCPVNATNASSRLAWSTRSCSATIPSRASSERTAPRTCPVAGDDQLVAVDRPRSCTPGSVVQHGLRAPAPRAGSESAARRRRDSASAAGVSSATTRPAVDHRDTVAQALGLLEEMRDEHDRHAAVADAARSAPRCRAGPAGQGPWSARRGPR